MITFPNAKINLGLNILFKREDGFHAIDSVFYPIKGLCDALEIIESDSFSFTSSGLDIPGDLSQNLCVKAYELLANEYKLPSIKMHLHKVIPMGAGLGGGSADGAFAINMLNDIFKLRLTEVERESFAVKLGSDCPFFIKNKTTHVSGRGENLREISVDLSDYTIVLINPGLHIGTKEAYAGVIPNSEQKSTLEIVQKPIESWNTLSNNFEKSVFSLYPEIEAIKNSLYHAGAVYASMTGSGSSVYGIFRTEPTLNFATKDYFVWKGKM